jgi:hypothetical protein
VAWGAHINNTKNSKAYQTKNIPMEIFCIHNSDFNLKNCKCCHLNEHTKHLQSQSASLDAARYSKLFETLKANSRIKKGTFPVATNCHSTSKTVVFKDQNILFPRSSSPGSLGLFFFRII